MNEIDKLNPEDWVRVNRLKTPEECEQFAKNVDQTHPHLALAARRRAVALRADGHNPASPVLRDIWEAVYAYEEVLFQEHGRRLRAGHTRRSITARGELNAIEEIVKRRSVTDGFHRMRNAGLFDKTFEAVVLRHPHDFSQAAIESATAKLNQWETGLDTSSGS
ncbi:hypothetical protein WQE_15371 [Paraburkholderia hospita]|uniref:Uncharacterized protein n=1 Tax=Paraburkholderia hospita TaxID=169430 RepID=A0ABP2PSF0_9BURK|nr:hypothetical protein [Paraburkholderia hospita]EIN00423.1 hypothetical protein WQE_15371 [Paraburkholderia hospita]